MTKPPTTKVVPMSKVEAGRKGAAGRARYPKGHPRAGQLLPRGVTEPPADESGHVDPATGHVEPPPAAPPPAGDGRPFRQVVKRWSPLRRAALARRREPKP